MAESADIKTDAFRELYAEFGDDVVQRCVSHHIRHAGISRVRKIELYHKEFVGQTLSPADLNAWIGRYAAIVESKVVAAPAVPGAVEFLQAAQGRLKLFVISGTDRKSTRLNSSHRCISYAVFCLKKKKIIETSDLTNRDKR